MYEVVPGVLEKDWHAIEKRLSTISQFANSAHIDFIDGKFADNKTYLDPAPFKRYSSKLDLEAHLMVVNPIQYIQPLAKAGFKRFIGHIERMPSQGDFVSLAKKYGEVGLALDGPTPLDQLHIHIGELDNILIFTASHVGESGQTFDLARLDRVKELRKQSDISIEVDGGINDKTIYEAKRAGANRFVSTGYISFSKDPKSSYQNLVARI
jgi:ribulose-phosphate 3-epimerase